MKEKAVSPGDLKELVSLIREIVRLQIKYIDCGFTPKEIAGTFSKIYRRQFERLLTPAVVAKIERGSYQSQGSPLNNADAAISYCLTLCGEIMKEVTDTLKNRKR